MKNKFKDLGALLLVCGLFFSCSGKDPYVGEWRLDASKMKEFMRKKVEQLKKDRGKEGEAMAQMTARMMEQWTKTFLNVKMTLVLNNDHTASFFMEALGKKKTNKGTWEVRDGKLVVTPEKQDKGTEKHTFILKGDTLEPYIETKDANKMIKKGPPFVFVRVK